MPKATFARIDLAREQLDLAIELFLSGRSDVSALTLAGAAEEVLGQALKHQGGQTAMDSAFEATSHFYRLLHGQELKRKDFAESENEALNAAKHMRNAAETSITTDIRRAAQWMIVRACANSDRLDLPRSDGMATFDNWFYEYEVGV